MEWNIEWLEWLRLFWGFFLANVLGYGGGPASIPLMYNEIVTHYHWLDDTAFSNVLALANTLPGPIATKIAAYTGFDVSGVGGMIVAMTATIVPSAAAMIILLRLLQKYRTSPVVKGLTLLVQPVIAVMMLLLTWQLAGESYVSIGLWQTLLIAAAAFWAMQIRKIHPAFVIVGAFVYGAIVLPYFI